jgi:mono/diheme cytochrome c family protein
MNSVRGRSTGFLVGSLLLVTLVWWGCGGGGGQETGETSTPAAEAPSAETETAAVEPSVDLGKTVYMQRCATCHGESGKGDGPAGKALNPPPRDHTNKEYMDTLTDDQIRTTVMDGKGAMPPHKALLNDAELTSVVMYVRSLSS